MRKIISLGASFAIGVALCGAAAAQPHGEWGHGPMEFLHGLNLSEAQESQVHQIMKSGWDAAKPIMTQLRAAHEAEISALLGSGSVTAESLAPTLAQEQSLRAQLEQQRLTTMLQVRAVLTPEQLSAAATKHAQIEQLHQQEDAIAGADE